MVGGCPAVMAQWKALVAQARGVLTAILATAGVFIFLSFCLITLS